jgi:hypothetical protein
MNRNKRGRHWRHADGHAPPRVITITILLFMLTLSMQVLRTSDLIAPGARAC